LSYGDERATPTGEVLAGKWWDGRADRLPAAAGQGGAAPYLTRFVPVGKNRPAQPLSRKIASPKEYPLGEPSLFPCRRGGVGPAAVVVIQESYPGRLPPSEPLVRPKWLHFARAIAPAPPASPPLRKNGRTFRGGPAS